jgi:hypothetical protein
MAKTRLVFGEWTPDQPGVTGSVTDALNCYPVANGYASLNKVQPYPNADIVAGETLLNAFSGKFASQNTLFAASATKLYRFDSGNNEYDDISKAGGYSALAWDITQFGPKMILANGINKLQAYNLAGGTTFGDLSADAPTAKYVTVVRDFVVAGNVAGAESTVYWCDINNETNWTASASSQADSQVLPDGGDITGVSGGEYGLIFLERAIYRMTYSGSPFFFQFDAISRAIGCISNGSIAQLADKTYFLADDGFYMCNGQTVTPIGAEKVNRWFFENAAPDLLTTQMSATIDPIRSLIIWIVPTNSGNKLLIYNAQVNKWSYSNESLESLNYLLTSSATLESLDKISITPGQNTQSGTYTQSTTTVTVTLTAHKLQTGAYIYFNATSGGATDGFYQITVTDANTFTFTETISATITTSNCVISLPSIDNLTASLDDRAYAGGTWFLGGVKTNQIYGFTGGRQDASISSNDIDIGRSLITLAKPIVDGGSANVSVASRVLLGDTVNYGNQVAADAENRASLRSNGNYHRIRVQPTGTGWKTIVGVDIEYATQGTR